ncbi:MAG TPA: chemotaxis protein CheW [Clostridia bacterium]|jgi:purine-binding chemotaxis protein CheW|nr:chemotaxis protein CheW [Clostridia bacterium]
MTLENIKMERIMNIDIDGYLILVIGSKRALIRLRHVKEIIGMRDFTRVPGLPEYMLGVTNVRGQIVPVCDIARRLSLISNDNRKRSIVIVETSHGDLGLVVDELEGIKRELDLSKVKRVEVRDNDFFKGYYLEGKEELYMLDFMEQANENI